MDNYDCILIIEINYNNSQLTIESINMIEINDIIKQSINKFNIESSLQQNICFTFIDKEGNKKIIKNKKDIINCSKELIANKYLSKLNLEILSKEEKEKIENESRKEKEEPEAINELKINSQELSFIQKNNLSNKTNINNKQNLDMKNIIDEMKKEFNNILIKQEEKFDEKLKNLKNIMISEIKDIFAKENKDELLSYILDNIVLIKENMNINLEQNNSGKNNDINNSNMNNIFFNNMMKMKRYRCQNCNMGYIFHECFNNSENKYYEQHNLKLEDIKENKEEKNENEKNEEIININENHIKNNKKKREIFEISTKSKDVENDNANDPIKKDYININNIEEEKVDNKKDNKEEDKKEEKEEEDNKEEKEEEDNKEENKKEEIEEEEEINENKEDDLNFEEEIAFQNILQKYFFNEGELIVKEPTDDELKEIENYYNVLHEKNFDIDSYQKKYIDQVEKEIAKYKNRKNRYQSRLRKQKLQSLLENFMSKFEKQENNNKNEYRKKKNYYNYYNYNKYSNNGKNYNRNNNRKKFNNNNN